jgi:cyclopropane-fatty-acyl-phospholipid synthase
MDLAGFLRAARAEGFELVSLHDDSESYRRTIEAWARNLEASLGLLEARYGCYDVRRFRMYLWGSAQGFREGALQCHRLVIRAPGSMK